MTRFLRLLLAAYLVALAASHVVRALVPAPGVAPTVKTVTVAAGDRVPTSLRIVYDDIGVAAGGTTPIVILHGSPGGRRELEPLARALATGHRVLVPDLPGYGDSTRRVADYGFPAQAGAVLALLDAARIQRAHLVGFSMGGGVAITLAAAHPDRVASLALVSALGVQEMELFGDYRLNHYAHGAQLAALLALREGVPHFGWLDDSMLSVEYARTFFDSDQRPLRAALAALSMPVRIVHGRQDPLVPVAAAREHARLVPQAELVLEESDHFMIDRDPAQVARVLAPFVARVDAGQGVTRAHADPARVAAALAPFDPATEPPPGPVARVVLVLVLALGTLASEDLTCIGAGMLVAHGRLGFAAAVTGCFAGIFVGDLGLFFAGRLLGRLAFTRWPLSRVVTPEGLDRAAAWLHARGTQVIVASRFLPGTRLPTYVAAGALGFDAARYAATFALAALAWTPLLVGLSLVATRLSIELAPHAGAAGAMLLGGGLVGATRVGGLLLTREGRRRLVSMWARTTRWEFWPAWILYVPVAAWIARLALRHGSLTVFTAANPGMPAAGFIGESKADILGALETGGAPVAPFTIVDPARSAAERAAVARAFAAAHGLPLVLKPDQGQRGTGVRILRTAVALDEAVACVATRSILQVFVPGPEFGLFYVRRPTEPRGRLTAITVKTLPSVTGDGRRTLDQLIVHDERAVALMHVYRAISRERLADVPAAGERIVIGELGSHCRGAIFHDGSSLATPRLDAAVERAARAMPGFGFGRFDVRSPSTEALQRGDFTILELNGVTAEPTEIYDPARSAWSAWRTLARTWTLAFAIGQAEAERGARVWTLRELVRLALDYRRGLRVVSASATASAGRSGCGRTVAPHRVPA